MSDEPRQKCKDAEIHGHVTLAEMYKEGSASLRNYSNLTMSVRTLAMHLFLGSAVVLAVAISQDLNDLPTYALGGAVGLAAFSFALFCINWHFATAFNVIRNSMVDLEGATLGNISQESQKPPPISFFRRLYKWIFGSKDRPNVSIEGPWQGHKRIRGGWKDPVAYSAPFTALFFLAFLLAALGLHGKGYLDWSVGFWIAIILTAIVASLGGLWARDPD